MKDKCKVGVIGCGDISGVYLNSLVNVFDNTEVVAVSSRGGESARRMAQRFGIPVACSNEELLAMDIDIAVVLTDPLSHAAVVEQCLLAGKNTYVEKPIATNTADAKRLLALAEEKGLMLACAPDTLLGAGTQMCRQLIEDGLIGSQLDNGLEDKNYYHQFVTRKMVSQTVHGDHLGRIPASEEHSKTYNVVVDAEWNLAKTYIYALAMDAEGHVNNMQVCLLDGGSADYEYKN